MKRLSGSHVKQVCYTSVIHSFVSMVCILSVLLPCFMLMAFFCKEGLGGKLNKFHVTSFQISSAIFANLTSCLQIAAIHWNYDKCG